MSFLTFQIYVTVKVRRSGRRQQEAPDQTGASVSVTGMPDHKVESIHALGFLILVVNTLLQKLGL